MIDKKTIEESLDVIKLILHGWFVNFNMSWE